jgi:hypothetical protein
MVTLYCSASDNNGDGLADGQAADTAGIGPETFCGDNVCLGSISASIEIMSADADMDDIPNDEDFTPELCDEERKGTEGVAALVFYHFGDSGIINLFQSVGINLSQVYNAYDYVVLLADNAASNPMNLDAATFARADLTLPPTREGLMDAMQHLTAKGFRFDYFGFGHGYKSGAEDASFEVLEGSQVTGDWLISATDPNSIGTARHGVPLMAWWSTTCIAARQIDAWIEIGGLADSGAADVEFLPNAFGNYIANWVSGQTYRNAVDASRTRNVIGVAEFAVRQQGMNGPWFCNLDDPATPAPNDGPGFVTGNNACADDFFNDNIGPNDAKYDIWEVYDTNLSGAENMAVSSARTFLGDQTLTFGAPGRDWP